MKRIWERQLFSGALPFTVLTILYCLLYEWVNIFDLAGLKAGSNGLKLLLPAVLLLLCSRVAPDWSLSSTPRARSYILFFVVFMVWGLVPNLLSGHLHETMVQWLKFLPRLVGCYAIFLYLLARPEANTGLMKGLIAVALGAVLQYAFLSAFHVPGDMTGFFLPIFRKVIYYGPLGLFGSGTSHIFLRDMDLHIFRLTGFWLEPSQVSGFLVMAFFLAKAVFAQTGRWIWRFAGLLCLMGGLLTFSNAGYFALGCALLVGYVIQMATTKSGQRRHLAGAVLMVVFIYLVVFGRDIVATHFSKNEDLKYLVGVRGSVMNPYGGRVEQLVSNLKTVLEHPLGIGFRIPGRDAFGAGFDFSSFAPVLWLVSTGWIGLFLLLARESCVVRAMRRAGSNGLVLLAVCQAWVAVFSQNLVYGTWGTPLYFVLVGIVFSAASVSGESSAGGE